MGREWSMPNSSEARFPGFNGVLAVVVLQSFIISGLGQFGLQGTTLFLRAAGYSSEIVGMVYLATVPWIFRFLLAPCVDRYGSRAFGHFRMWLLLCHALSLALVASFLLVEPSVSPYPMLIVCGFLSLVIGVHQLAMFGLIATRIEPARYTDTLAIQSVAYGTAGVVVGGAVMYFLADLGWNTTIMALAAIAALTLIPLLFVPLDRGFSTPPATASFKNRFAIFKRPDARYLLGLALLLEAGMAGGYGLQSILLIDAGFSVGDASLVTIVAASAATIVGSIVAKPLVDQLGAYPAMAIAGGLIGGVTVLYGTLSYFEPEPWVTVAFILMNSATIIPVFVATRSVLLAICGDGRKTTDSAAFTAVEAFAFLAITGISAALVDYITVPIVLGVTGLGSLIGALLAARRAKLTVTSPLAARTVET
jgi:predicted MFS family arabinose efflux permease